MRWDEQPIKLSPREFEIEIQRLINNLGVNLLEFKTQHLEKLRGSDGEYTIDVTARFEALGANFLVLIECKQYSHPVEREAVELLNSRMKSVGAQKGMIFSTARFQSGAIEFAQAHGIALIWIASGKTSFIIKADIPNFQLPSWVPKYVGWLVSLNNEGLETHRQIDSNRNISFTDLA